MAIAAPAPLNPPRHIHLVYASCKRRLLCSTKERRYSANLSTPDNSAALTLLQAFARRGRKTPLVEGVTKRVKPQILEATPCSLLNTVFSSANVSERELRSPLPAPAGAPLFVSRYLITDRRLVSFQLSVPNQTLVFRSSPALRASLSPFFYAPHCPRWQRRMTKSVKMLPFGPMVRASMHHRFMTDRE